MMNDELNKYKITNIATLKRYLRKIWKEISLEKVEKVSIVCQDESKSAPSMKGNTLVIKNVQDCI